jgi:hypothetical protein
MARLKTAYRHDAEPEITDEPPDTPAVEIDGKAATESGDDLSPIEAEEEQRAEAVADAAREQAAAEASKSALMRQIEALHEAGEVQRQHAAHLAQVRPRSREDKLAYWQQAGMPEAELKFLAENPEMIDHDAIAAAAAQEAMAAGISRESPEFLPAVKEAFDKRFRHLQAAGAAQAPAFFRPEPPKPGSIRDEGFIVSAPVSRDTLGGSRIETNPARVKLTPEEVAAAQAAGITLRTYAEGKLRLALEKKQGIRQ